MTRVPVNPELLRWARERSGLAPEDLATKFKRLPEWEAGETYPTLKLIEAFARAVHVPVGSLFLAEPPDELIPIPDFRTFAGQPVTSPHRTRPALHEPLRHVAPRTGQIRPGARWTGRVMAGFAESEVEQATLGWLQEIGWSVLHGPDIAPDTPDSERAGYDDVVLALRLRDSLACLNPDLPASAVGGVFRKPSRPEGALDPQATGAICARVPSDEPRRVSNDMDHKRYGTGPAIVTSFRGTLPARVRRGENSPRGERRTRSRPRR